MRTPVLVGIVVAAHCLAVASVGLIQGCGMTRGPIMSGGAEREVLPPILSEPPAPPPVKDPRPWPAETTAYVVAKGDSLSVIAKRHGISVAEITTLNGITNPDRIIEGQKLVLPGKIDLAAPRPVKKPAMPTPTDGDRYVVQPGDSLSALAVRFGTTVGAIKSANGLTGDKIMVDQKLSIPGVSGSGVLKPMRKTTANPPSASPRMPDLDLDADPLIQTPAPPVSRAVGVPKAPSTAEPESGAVLSSGADAAAVERTPAEYRIHVVEAEEDLYSIAMLWGVSVSDLKVVNDLVTAEIIEGQRLKIPMTD